MSKLLKIGTLTLLLFSAMSSVAMAVSFSDVNSSTSYRTAILWAQNKGIVSGYGDGTFHPDDCVRRAELLKMVYKYMNSSVGKNSSKTFYDVQPTDWFASYVKQATADNVVDGYPDGSFRPNICVNRVEAMKIATNALFHHPDLSNFGGVVYYDDKLIVDMKSYDWYAPYANFLFKKRLVGTNHTSATGNVNGITTINFFPDGVMTRKEVAELLYRYDEYKGYYPTPNPVPPVNPTLGTPSLIYPASNQVLTNLPRQTLFQWSGVSNATQYQVEVGCDFCNGGVQYSNPVTYSTTSTSLYQTMNSDNNFRFRVRALGSNNVVGPWSNYSYFSYNTSAAGLTAPTLIYPASNQVLTNFPRQTLFQWSAVSNATQYQVEVGCDLCNGGVQYSNPVTYTTTSTSLYQTMNSDNNFRFRVRAFGNNNAVGPWSNYSYFSYNTAPAGLTAPTLISPTPNQVLTNFPRQTLFQWSAVNNATQYQVEVGCDLCNGGVQYSNPMTYSTTNIYLYQTMNSDNNFRFRVRALDNNNVVGPWSNYSYFSYHT